MTFTTEELVQTVAAYEANDRNQRATALSLGLARSTLQNRLRRAAERGLLGYEPVLEGFAVKSVASKTADGAWVKQVKEHGAAWEVPTGHRVKAVSA
ncbi:helix-turn-helix domain-containing protein, partial [Bosea thiooxidans]